MNLNKDVEHHLFEYLILLVGLTTFVVLYILYNHTPLYQTYIALSGVSFYFVWGVFHHMLRNRLNIKIFMEYFLFGLLAFLILYFVSWL